MEGYSIRWPNRVRTVILGAAGRDFHNFNLVYRDDPASEVVAFTAAQIPGIAGRRYPPALAGRLYPEGIPIVPEAGLESLCRRERVARVVFAYSDDTSASCTWPRARSPAVPISPCSGRGERCCGRGCR